MFDHLTHEEWIYLNQAEYLLGGFFKKEISTETLCSNLKTIKSEWQKKFDPQHLQLLIREIISYPHKHWKGPQRDNYGFIAAFEKKTGNTWVESPSLHPSSQTHPQTKFRTPQGKIILVKHDLNTPKHRKGLTFEFQNYKKLKDIPGIVRIFHIGIVNLPNTEQMRRYGCFSEVYLEKEFLPGPDLEKVISTHKLTQMMINHVSETVNLIHQRGRRLEPDMKGSDWILDINARPTLVDLEFIEPLARGTGFVRALEIRKDNRKVREMLKLT